MTVKSFNRDAVQHGQAHRVDDAGSIVRQNMGAQNLAVVAHQDLIYAIGGVGNGGATGRVEIYDPDADAWTAGSAKPTPVGFISAVEAGGKTVGTLYRPQNKRIRPS